MSSCTSAFSLRTLLLADPEVEVNEVDVEVGEVDEVDGEVGEVGMKNKVQVLSQMLRWIRWERKSKTKSSAQFKCRRLALPHF